jgi:NAD(P)-dependent dehydrogenase (short-subunit alcohol dehydrogenase family)
MSSVLITGASRGIGRATALRLAAGGWDVFAGVRQEVDAESFGTGAGAGAGAGGRITPVVLDITDADQVAALDVVLPRRLDAVVNNAGIVVGGPVEGLAVDELRRQLEVNLIGQVAVTQALLPRIRESRGRIVFVSSLSGWISSPMVGAYSASKFGLEAIADALRLELRPWRIPVVLVEPAQTDTDMWRLAGDQLEDTVAQLSPEIRRLYAKHIEGQRKSIPKGQKMATPTDGAAATIERALTAGRPRARYIVGTGPRIMGTTARFVPTRIMDAVLSSTGGVPRRP